jgi:hypothetical protein
MSRNRAANGPHDGGVLVPALTVRQPNASLILGRVPSLPGVFKDVENRGWRTPYRRIWIHAAARRRAAPVLPPGIEIPDAPDLPRGVLLGTVTITDIVTDSPSVWAVPGQYHWLLTDPRPLDEPIPITGRYFCWSTDQLAAIPPP